MSDNTTTGVGVKITFRQLFDHHRQVDIPIIQRDYAQGRSDVAEVRAEFLTAIHSALSKPKDDPSLPLDLDFIYGSIEGDRKDTFCPLDGQQRLTTLFLLHWYLAWKDDKHEHFVSFVNSGPCSRFSYRVRPSSKEFFDRLVQYCPDSHSQLKMPLSATIEDQPWFFRSWKLDPTIQSSLTMLDAIDDRFRQAQGWYDRLLNPDAPRITFQLLDLRGFGLTDELYIKMNARGKQLTPFESFKARLEQHLDTIFPTEQKHLHGGQVSVRDYFSHQIDTEWADLFWLYRNSTTHLFDDKVMNLIRALVMVTRAHDDKKAETLIRTLRRGPLSFLDYVKRGCLDASLLNTLITSLDCWKGGTKGIRTHLDAPGCFDEKSVFERVIDGGITLTYEDLVLFAAYVGYLREHSDNLKASSFGEWMRVLSNLAFNQTYDGADDCWRSLRSVNEMLPNSHRIVDFLADDDVVVRGFNEQQIREERLKAQLMVRNPHWREPILKAEGHGYFKGQIEFLFKFCGVLDAWLTHGGSSWGDDEDARYRQSFTEYFDKACAIFDDTGLRSFPQHLWERALLALGNYLFERGRNLTFLYDSHRYASWKRLLQAPLKPDGDFEQRRQLVKQLLDSIDVGAGVERSLQSVVDAADPANEWRRLLVIDPAMCAYCTNRMIRSEPPDCVYLLRKTQMNGEHVELFSYHLFTSTLSEKEKDGDLGPFVSLRYVRRTDRYQEPCIVLEFTLKGDLLRMEIEHDHSQWRFQFSNPQGELPTELEDVLTTRFLSSGTPPVFCKDRSEFEAVFHEIQSALNDLIESAE